jgi:hypothetical protein
VQAVPNREWTRDGSTLKTERNSEGIQEYRHHEWKTGGSVSVGSVRSVFFPFQLPSRLLEGGRGSKGGGRRLMRIYTAIMSNIDGKPETLLREGCFARREWSCRSQWWMCFAEERELGSPCSGGEDYRKGVQRSNFTAFMECK